MKKIQLMKKDVYDLASVMGTVVNEQAASLDFKDILHLQKMVNYFVVLGNSYLS